MNQLISRIAAMLAASGILFASAVCLAAQPTPANEVRLIYGSDIWGETLPCG